MRELQSRRRAGAGASDKGEDRVLQILSAAQEILIRDGYRGLTLRRIADECGISVGNLNYYYRRKADLLHDLVRRVFDAYLAEFDRIRAEGHGSARAELEAVLRFLFEDLSTRETTVFFPEIWALANHDEDAAEAVDEIYRNERLVFEELIPKVNPRLRPEQIETLAVFASASIEGHTMFVADGKPWMPRRKELQDNAIKAILDLIDAA